MILLGFAAGSVLLFNYSTPAPNIILITVDTLRADHLDVYGYERETAPVIAGLAGDGIRFKYALAQAPWTLPSLASIHTSLYPSAHDAITAKSRISEEITNLAETLSDNGYYTIGIVSHHFADSSHGFAQGFHIFDESIIGKQEVTSEAITDTALEYLSKVEKLPFFLWVHYFDPHCHYVRHPEYDFASGYTGFLPEILTSGILNKNKRRLKPKDIKYIKAVYDEEIAYTDRAIGRLLGGIEELGPANPQVRIFTADHGEYFMEHGNFLHGRDVYNPLVHVPLIISGDIDPALRGHVSERTVELASLPATIMAMADIAEHPFQGEDLLAAELTNSPPGFCFTEGSYAFDTKKRKRAVVYQDWKLIYNIDNKRYELYNLSTDRRERHNLWRSGEPDAVRMRKLLRPRLVEFGRIKGKAAPKIELTPEQLENLRSLGYIN